MKISIILSLLLLALITAPAVAAQTAKNQNCQPIYGGGETCAQSDEFSVNLQVKHPQNNSYVENLIPADASYLPNQPVIYRITIKNTAKKALPKGTVTLVFPQDITYVSGGGTFDQKSRKLAFSLEELKAEESKVLLVNGKIIAKPQKSNLCTFTQAIGTFNKKNSQDNTQLCIGTTAAPKPAVRAAQTKGGLPVHQPVPTQKTPETGPEALALIGLLPAGALGIWLRRKS